MSYDYEIKWTELNIAILVTPLNSVPFIFE